MKVFNRVLLVMAMTSLALTNVANAKSQPKATKNGYATIYGMPAYPSEDVPKMSQYAENIDTKQVYRLDTKPNQTKYTMVLPAPARYRFYSWVNETQYKEPVAAYTKCNGKYDCMENKNAHEFAIVTLKPKQVIKDFRIADWFFQEKVPNLVPMPPTKVTILKNK